MSTLVVSPRQHIISLTSILKLFFGFCLFLEWASGIDAAGTTNSGDEDGITTAPQPTGMPSTTKTIEFSSAVILASSVSRELAQFDIIPAIPIPTNVTDLPHYEAVSKFADVMPPLPVGFGVPDADSMVAELIASTNTTTSEPSLAERQSTLRVMIVGDSMTAGQEGDWTWRYRIWQFFKNNGISFRFVGPYTGTKEPAKPAQPSPPPLYGTTQADPGYASTGGYAKGVDAGFLANSNHFAWWGRAAAVDKGLIQGVLQNNMADLMLLMLGFNDLGWFYSDANGLIDSIGTLVSNARAANPNLKFAIANVPQRTFIGGRQDLVANTNVYNNLLPNAIAKWTTPQSPIYLVQLKENYECAPGGCPAGYDGLHPNALGDYEIARAFSQTLVNNFAIGTTIVSVPTTGLGRDLPMPSNFQLFASPQGVTGTWDAVYGAYGYDVQVSINGGGGGFSAGSVLANRWDSTWPLDGWTYAVSVRASAGDNVKGPWTGTQTVVAKPQLAPAPQNVKVLPSDGGMTVTWDPPTGPYTDSIVEYNVIFWDQTTPCQFLQGAAFKSSPAVISGLHNGASYLVAPVAWNKNGQGWPLLANNVVPGAGTPAPPTGLQMVANDGTSLHLTWSGSSGAGGYQVWSRNVNNASNVPQLIANTSTTCNDEYFLFPGTWNYEWSLAAYNGNLISNRGAAILAPSPASGASGPGQTCPAPPPWCAGGAGGSDNTPPDSSPPPGSSSVTVIGGSTTVSSSTTVIGGVTTTISGTKTVISGTTSTIRSTSVIGGTTSTIPGSNTNTPVPTNTNYPIVTDGQCVGPDCHNGQCTGLLCESIGCIGSGCSSGVCRSSSCTIFGCIGPSCYDGVCRGAGCITRGCVGPNCGGGGRCTGFNCLGIDCIGPDCGGDGICFGPNCSEGSCSGPDCLNGGCVGPSCNPFVTIPGGGSGAPKDNPNKSCTLSQTIASSCVVTCKPATPTASCTTNCAQTSGCGVTATTKTTTVSTNAYVIPTPVYDNYNFAGDDAQWVLAIGSAGMSSEDAIDSQTSTAPPSTTTNPAYPTASTGSSATALCYSGTGYNTFSLADANTVVANLCGRGNTLTPGQTNAYVEQYSGSAQVFAAAGWASNQAGCQPEKNYLLSGNACKAAFQIILSSCPSNPGKGGGWIDSDQFGCILFRLGSTS